MLDGILNRGFASKCKASLKATKNRIDVIRRKRNATQKFLKKDIADLLANGLDINAYGRAEGLLVELNVSSCYDFVEQSCDLLLKHLLILQKLSHCPEDCREAVSSLMFAAARFSDLPELRELRQMLEEKYGNSLEHFVNQEFVENLASKPAAQERKIQLMLDIALEFKIKWDPRAFEKRMPRSPVNTEGQLKTYGSSLNARNDKIESSNGKEAELGGAKHGVFLSDTNKVAKGAQRFQSIGHDDPSKVESSGNRNVPQNGKVEATRVGKKVTALGWHEIGSGKEEAAIETCKLDNSSLGKRQEQKFRETKLLNGREIAVGDGGNPEFSSHAEDSMNLSGKLHEDENRKWKPYYSNSLPPPYGKSSPGVKDYKQGTNFESSWACDDDKSRSLSSSKNIRSTGSSEKSHLETSHYNHEREPAKDYKDQFYDGNPLPKPRSMRRKHSKSRSNHDGTLEDRGNVKRKSSSQRRDEKKGLQLLIEEEKHQKDEEERIMDKLLIHYSKKPSKLDPTMVRRKPITDLMGVPPPPNEIRDAPGIEVDTGSLPTRSISLPHEHVGPSEGTKVYARAASFQLDKSKEAKHVHPKLPDYDELAARFAAMRGR